jgi:1,2-diacylglycerol 3-alpha-glucosyltransferase
VNPDQRAVAVIFHRLGPYHVSRLKAASYLFEVIAIEQSAETSEYAWQKVMTPPEMRRLTLFPANQSEIAPRELCRRTTEALDGISPLRAVAIPGWSNLAALVALRWCIARNVPCIVMSESGAGDKNRSRWKEWVKGKIVTAASAALAGGCRHRDYLIELGFESTRIFLGYDAVDNDYFHEKAEEVRARRSEARREYGLPENYFLASARFIEKKNLSVLLRAYAEYYKHAANTAWHLVLLGDGPLRRDLCHLISELGLSGVVVLPGFKQYHELPVYYGLARAFVHASKSEPWGLVVNEAMASGLPVIVSNTCGCVPDLLEEAGNGFSFAPDDIEGLARLLSRVAAFPDAERERMGRESRKIIASWSPQRFANGLRDTIEAAEYAPRRKIQPITKLLLSLLIFVRLGNPGISHENRSPHL